MKKLFSLLVILTVAASLWGCHKPAAPEATTEPSIETDTHEGAHFDLNEIDLAGIGERLAGSGTEDSQTIQLDGLCTPVVLELEGTELMSISAYDVTVYVAPAAEEYNSIYGNVSPMLYEHNGLILLNIWQDEIGYTCVIFPDNTYREDYPDEKYSVMLYVDETGRLVEYRFARKFQGVEQWETGPIDLATSRDDFYYSLNEATWTDGKYTVISDTQLSISDCFDLDDIFNNAKKNGLFSNFETLDELLACNASEQNENFTRDNVTYFDELQGAFDYDQNGNLITEAFYTLDDQLYFMKTHTYDEKNRDIAGKWSYEGEEAYRYTNAYDDRDRLTETVWYRGGQEVERFTYTHDPAGGHTETFSQNGQKKYTYRFDKNGQLAGHCVYRNGKEIETKDIKSLVKTQLLTDIWFPFMDNGTLYFDYRYDGTVPLETPAGAEATTAPDGSYIMVLEETDNEDGVNYRHEYHYNARDQLLKDINWANGEEFNRDEYQYDDQGRCIRQTTYIDGELSMTQDHEYNKAGQRIQTERVSVEPETEYLYESNENGMDDFREITYTNKTTTYRYNDLDLLVETVYYADGEEFARTTYDYDENGYVLPSTDTYQYVYSPEGVLEEVWLVNEDWSAGAALLRSRTVYVTADNARQLRDILRDELTWF